MTQAAQKDAIEALQDWSKWTIGIGFAAGSGCVVILRGAADGLPRTLLVAAIAAFVLSVLVALILRHALARTVERLPLTDAEGGLVSIHDHRPAGPVSIAHLARAQLWLMTLGALALLGWVVALPA